MTSPALTAALAALRKLKLSTHELTWLKMEGIRALQNESYVRELAAHREHASANGKPKEKT